jgi:hypothetical protein
MKEYVGKCVKCQKDLFCIDGFFQGELDSGHAYCYECYETLKKESDHKPHS